MSVSGILRVALRRSPVFFRCCCFFSFSLCLCFFVFDYVFVLFSSFVGGVVVVVVVACALFDSALFYSRFTIYCFVQEDVHSK